MFIACTVVTVLVSLALLGSAAGKLTRQPMVVEQLTAVGVPDSKFPQLAALEQKIISSFDRQSDAFYTSGRLLDDGVVDPRDTRRVLGLAFDICRRAERRTLRPVQFGVARP